MSDMYIHVHVADRNRNYSTYVEGIAQFDIL